MEAKTKPHTTAIIMGIKNELSPPNPQAEGISPTDVEIVVSTTGLKRFADDLISQGVQVVQVDWVPPARGNPRLANLLSRLMD